MVGDGIAEGGLTQGSKNNVQCFSPVLLLNKDLGRENLEYGVWSRKRARVHSSMIRGRYVRGGGHRGELCLAG